MYLVQKDGFEILSLITFFCQGYQLYARGSSRNRILLLNSSFSVVSESGVTRISRNARISTVEARKKFHRRSQPEFPGAFKIVDFQRIFLMFGFWERRNGHLRAATAQPLAAGYRAAELFPGLIYEY